MKKVLFCEDDTLPGACGVGILYEFSVDVEDTDDNYGWSTPIDDGSLSIVGGAGWFTAGFINDQDSKDVWNYLTKRFKVAYKTPIRKNTNSNNDFLFVIFDGKSPRAKNARSLKWPFKDKK